MGFGLAGLETDVFKMILRRDALNKHPLLGGHHIH